MTYFLALTIHPRYEDTKDYQFWLLREIDEGLVGNFTGPGSRLLITATEDSNLDGAMAIDRTGVYRQRMTQFIQWPKVDAIFVQGSVALEQAPAITDADGVAFLHRCLAKFGCTREQPSERPPWRFRLTLAGIRKQQAQTPP